MQFKNNLINAALLGTERKTFDANELPEAVQVVVQLVQQSDNDTESQFIKTSALALGYLKAGAQPLKLALEPNEAPAETQPVCNDKANAILVDLLNAKQYQLAHYWAHNCYNARQLVCPETLPLYLAWAKGAGKNEYLERIVGNRGKWLAQFYPEWQFVNKQDATWETATTDERVRLLLKMRQTEPDQARELIQTTWKEENAAGRLALLDTLSIGLNATDEDFLHNTLTDKSQKVKDLALSYLKLIPTSSILIKYEEVLKGSIVLLQSKMLGLISKTSITIKLQGIDDSIYATGISKLSADKKISDEEQTLRELVAEVHPDFWLKHFGQSEMEVVELFKKRKDLLPYFPSLCSAVTKFGVGNWFKALLEHWENPELDLLGLLPPTERRAFAHKFYHHAVSDFVVLLVDHNYTPFSHPLAMTIMGKIALQPAQFSQNDIELLIPFLPQSILTALDALAAPTEIWYRNTWDRHKEYIKTMVPITEQIKTAFA